MIYRNMINVSIAKKRKDFVVWFRIVLMVFKQTTDYREYKYINNYYMRLQKTSFCFRAKIRTLKQDLPVKDECNLDANTNATTYEFKVLLPPIALLD